MSVLPNFLVIGAAKTGTTSLYYYLRAHPEVYVPEQKELDYFVAQVVEFGSGTPAPAGNWTKGQQWYERQFAAADGAFAVGEISPRYSMAPSVPGVPARIARLLPAVKLIYVVRDPIERMVSHYVHRTRSMTESRPPEIALTEGSVYVHASRYAHQIDEYMKYFPRSQLLVLVSERLRADRQASIARICDFLGVGPEPGEAAESSEYHVSADRRGAPRPIFRTVMTTQLWGRIATAIPEPTKRWGRHLSRTPLPQFELSPQLRRRLTDLVRDDVAQLRSYAGDGFDGWEIA